MALSSEFVTLVQQEIPEGRQSLSDSHANLEKVAAYCIENFARMVMIHKEKVARREIGVLTTNKTTARQYKILAPANTEKPIKYVRKPIDFSCLDDIGHGIRSSSSSTPRSRRSASSVGMPPPTHQPPTSAGPAPTTKPPTPPQANRSVSSLSRGSREYRTPPAVAPPQVPSNYAPNYPIGHPRRNDRSSGYSTLPHPSAAHVANANHNGGGPAPPPQVGMVHPMAHGVPQGSYTPPPPPPHMQEPSQYAAHNVGMPPPPSPASSGVISEQEYNSRSSGASSPPLPPPPPSDNEIPPAIPPHFMEKAVDDTPAPHRSANSVPPAVPPHYLEKVIAVYDYAADKEDELTFSENAVIYVLKKNDDGWWEGVMNGVTGLFPGNYVEPLM